MKNKKIKRIIIISFVVVIATAGAFVGHYIYEGYRIQHRAQQMFISLVREKEAAFHRKPDLLQSLVLMNYYYWDFHQYEKANYYADYCMKLGVEKTRRSWYVHMVKADVSLKNRDTEQACTHLRIAMQLAADYKIPEDQVKSFDLQDLRAACAGK